MSILKQKHMRQVFFSTLYKRILIVMITAFLPLLGIKAQKAPSQVIVKISLVDQADKPISEAKVVVGEGEEHIESDQNGIVWLTAATNQEVTIVKKGYQQKSLVATGLKAENKIVLEELPLMIGNEYSLAVPFSAENKRYAVGGSYKVEGAELERNPSTDIRQSLTGLVPGLEILEVYGGPGVSPLETIGRFGSSAKTSVRMRGATPIFMVDGIPTQISETALDPQQIESITVIKDVAEKSLYGPFAANGIVHITTKRGARNDRFLNVHYEQGVNVVDRFPEFVNGADYAKLNNIARNNSGVDMLYTREDVQRYALSDGYDMLYPNNDYRSMMLKNTMDYRRAGIATGGGNNVMNYYAYLGYAGEGDVYKIGPTSNYMRINFNANLDVKLNKFVTARFGFVSTIANRKSPNYGYNSNYSSESDSENTTMGIMEFPEILSDINTTPPIEFPVYANNDASLTKPWYAVSTNYTQNPIGNIMHNGEYTDKIRKGLINVALDLDFSFLLKGLKSSTYVAFDGTNLIRLGTAEDYDAYFIRKGMDIDGNEVPVLTSSSSHSLREMSGTSKLTDFMSQRLFARQSFTYDGKFGLHEVSGALNAFVTKRIVKYISEHRREATSSLMGQYIYDGKYIAKGTLNYSGTYSLKNNRWSLSPSIAAAWILSEENFMKDISFVDFLKLRTEFGILYYDASMSAYRDMDNFSWKSDGQAFGPYNNASTQWFGSTVSTGTYVVKPSLIGNKDLRLEKLKEFTIGLDALALNKRLYLEVGYFTILRDGPVTSTVNVIPTTIGIAGADYWLNYNKTRRFGLEVGAQFKDRIGKLHYTVSGNATMQNSRILKRDEVDYPYPYQSVIDYPAEHHYGLVNIGQFESQEDIQRVTHTYDDELHVGDLKYKDMNGDGIIDDSDRCYIGNSHPKLVYGLNINLQYENVDFSVSGTGRAFYKLAMTNSYFWNGWGDGNYSKFIKENHGINGYPRLAYYKVNNNYKMSDFWLQDGGYFKIQNVELGWSMPVKRWGLNFVDGIRVYAQCANLLTLSKVKDVDPESLSAGVSHYPLSRTFVGGVKFSF